MAPELTQLFRQALGLPAGDGATLGGLLIESLDESPEPDGESAWAAEAERRWREIESGAVQTIPWEEVKAKLLRG